MDNYLIHHGILGQKWGVRRFQDYDGKRIKSHEAKAAKYHKKAEKYSARAQKDWIDRDYKIKAKRYEKKALKEEQKAEGLKEKVNKLVSDHNVETGMIPPELVIAGIQISALALVGATTAIHDKIYKVNKTNSDLKQMDFSKKYSDFSDIPKNKEPDINKYIKDINPEYHDPKKIKAGNLNNCVLCSTALAMREKGYKVSAVESAHGFYPKEFYSRTFNNASYGKLKSKDPSKFVGKLESLGDGAYGHLGVTWINGSKHSLFFKNENGKLHIYDGQSGKTIDYKSNAFLSAVKLDKSEYVRLDNAEPNEKVLGALR